MWRRTSLVLILVRLFFALSPSYLHPDENFQGPEVIAGQIFNYPVKLTWEFTADAPIRSVFPLWPVYGLPMLLLKWLWGNGQNEVVAPMVVFYTLRILMFVLSFVLEDWAIQELVSSPRHRQVAGLLLASSYVTWTYQTHTFSNSVETLVLAWSLVVVQRIVEHKGQSSLSASAVLGFLVVFGVFNRITFPAFLFIPGLQLIPHLIKQPTALLVVIVSSSLTLLLAVSTDTEFYTPGHVTIWDLFSRPVITPLNNFRYNANPKNLASHGVHPWYQHLLVNMPELLGPAVLLLFCKPRLSLRLYSAISGIFVLSIFQHQEARFLLPTIPLILSSLQLPKNPLLLRVWIGSWLLFNAFFGILMGTYHQGGIIPTQAFLSQQAGSGHVFWWKTYSPPIWLLNGKNLELETHDLMGMKGEVMLSKLAAHTSCSTTSGRSNTTYLVSPLSATFLDSHLINATGHLRFEEVWRYRKHLNLDDLDFGDDGVWSTLSRVVGRRGLAVWEVTENC